MELFERIERIRSYRPIASLWKARLSITLMREYPGYGAPLLNEV